MRNLINGKELHSSNGTAIEVVNPARNQLIATVPNSTTEDVNLAVNAATSVQKKWQEIPINNKMRILKIFVELIEINFEILATTFSREAGIPITSARNDVSSSKKTVDLCIEKYIELFENNQTKKELISDNLKQITIKKPLGTVAFIIPFNLQLSIFCQLIISALIMGNTIIVNPPESNPLTIHKICLLLKDAGIPDGVINCISGKEKNILNTLMNYQNINVVTNKKMLHMSLEQKGNEAFIVAADADIDIAAKKALEERLYNAGQTHGFSKRFLVHYSIKDEFTKKIIEELRKIKVGDPLYISTELGCLISEEAAIKVEEQVRKSLSEGAVLAFGGRRMKAYFEPTVLVNVKKDTSIMNDMEIFGPIIPICGFTTIGEAIEIANQSSYCLCGNIITKDIDTAIKAAEKLNAQSVIINDSNYINNEPTKNYSPYKPDIIIEDIISTLESMSETKIINIKSN